MGISNLLPLMKNATTKTKLSNLQDTVAVVDTNGWIHRACYSCGDKVYMGEETKVYIEYCINMVKILRKHNITPILIFDGQSLPAKAVTKQKRQERKAQVRAEIEKLLRAGKTSQARYLMRTAVDVTFEMCRKVMLRCREEGIDYILAPFEADSQMVHMVNTGIADYAITEDSDLLVFGCKKILTKFDRENESGQMISLDKLSKCLPGYNHLKFQYLCILSGCDYLPNIANFGMGRARKFVDTLKINKFEKDDIGRVLRSIPNIVKVPKMGEVTNEYIDGFIRAFLTFNHQIVYCPIRKTLAHMRPLPSQEDHYNLSLFEFAGDFFKNDSKNFLYNYVLGNIHCKSLEQLECFDGDLEFSKSVQNRIKNASGLIMNFINNVEIKCDAEEEEEVIFVPESPIKVTKRKSTTETVTRTKRTKVESKGVVKTEVIKSETIQEFKSAVVKNSRYPKNFFEKNGTQKNDSIATKKSRFFRSQSVESYVSSQTSQSQ